MSYLPLLLVNSLEYQLTCLHLRQKGFMPSRYCELQAKYQKQNICILYIVENTYTETLTVVLSETTSWTKDLEEELRCEVALTNATIRSPLIKFGSFSAGEHES